MRDIDDSLGAEVASPFAGRVSVMDLVSGSVAQTPATGLLNLHVSGWQYYLETVKKSIKF